MTRDAAATQAPDGLSEVEAAARLRRDGPNAMPEERPHPLRRVLGRIWGPVPWMMEAAIALQLALGETTEAAVVAALLLFNAVVGATQQGRADAALAAMRARLAPQATVRRDGVWRCIPARDLVVGDVVKLGLGAIVPADARILTGRVLLDQSMLTGESQTVRAGTGATAYAGAMVRGEEAVAEITATGPRSYFGRAAELVRVAHAESAQQKAVSAIVRLLAMFNGAVALAMLAYALAQDMPLAQVLPLLLSAVLASVPVALSAAFTLTAALAARRLARVGVLLTRLDAVHDAATMSVLCSDKTGTLTRNEISISRTVPGPGITEADLLTLALLASSESGPDRVDAAVRTAAAQAGVSRYGTAERLAFSPFDPTRRHAAALARLADGHELRVLKGAPAEVVALCAAPLPHEAEALARQGFRLLAVAVEEDGRMRLAGLLALGDPPREDAAALISRLGALGIRTVMISGDGPVTAAVVAEAVGLRGRVLTREAIGDEPPGGDVAGFAALLPEDKLRIVRAFQHGGHSIGMCGDGVNDAPALRQAQMGIAVASATDVAKSAAGMVLTQPGLAGVVAAVEEGRATFRRLLTYSLGTIARKVELVLLLALGLALTGRAVLTPMLMVLFLALNDLLTLSLSDDRAAPGTRPGTWRSRSLLLGGLTFGLASLAFTSAALGLAAQWFTVPRISIGAGAWQLVLPPVHLSLDIGEIRTFVFLAIVFATQGVLYATRTPAPLWRTLPGGWVVLSSLIGLAVAITLAATGTLMDKLPLPLILGLLGAACAFTLLLDALKRALFPRLGLA